MKMIEKLIPEVVAKLAEYKEALFAIAAGLVGGGLKFWYDIRNGDTKWELSAFVLALTSSGFFAWATYFVCIEAVGWSPGLSVVAAGMVGHMGADKVKAKLLDFFINRIK